RGRAGGYARSQGAPPGLVAGPRAPGLPGRRPGPRAASADRQRRRRRRADREQRRRLSRDPVPGPGGLQPAVLRLERPEAGRRVRGSLTASRRMVMRLVELLRRSMMGVVRVVGVAGVLSFLLVVQTGAGRAQGPAPV